MPCRKMTRVTCLARPARPFRRRAGRSAFTLIELLLVLVILGILAGIVVRHYGGTTERARVSAANADIHQFENALDAFEVDAGRYPSSDEGLNALLVQPANVQSWHGPYVKQVNLDPWKNPYIYRFPGTNNRNGYDLLSMGPDGREGGGDDIDNWSQK